MNKKKEVTKTQTNQHVGGWQKCPKCDGEGSVSKPPSETQYVCDVCKGNKIIAMPVFPASSQATPKPVEGDGWIDAEKQKPPHNKGVMVFIPDEDFHQTSGMWDISNKWVLLDEYRVPENPVTHWRELYDIPEPYKTEQKEHFNLLKHIRKNESNKS